MTDMTIDQRQLFATADYHDPYDLQRFHPGDWRYDPDYLAACEFVSDVLGLKERPELVVGVASAEFCPIALTMARYAQPAGGEFEYTSELLSGELDEVGFHREMESYGGCSNLFIVDQGQGVMQFPTSRREWTFEFPNGVEQAERNKALANGFDFDINGADDLLRRTVVLPAAVRRFVQRFDAGDFPQLHRYHQIATATA
jgi:hypothetical protein